MKQTLCNSSVKLVGNLVINNLERRYIMANYIRAIMTIETTDPEEIERLLNYHIDYLIDMDDNQDIESISDVITYDIESKSNKDKLKILAAIISDVLETKPADDELNDKSTKDLYANIHNLKESLENVNL